MGTDVTPETIDTVLRILSWSVIAFGALWLVTGTIGYFHRRAYNLTHAESGRSKNIKPDFLKVDKAKRQAAIERGDAYTAVLAAREARTPVERVTFWSRVAAGLSAVLGLVAMIVGTITKVDSLQRGIDQVSSWERFSQLVSDNKAGAIVAIAVIGANIIVFAESSKKWRRSKAPAGS
jgi:uncharacterized membrane protein